MRRGFSASVIVRPPTFYPQPLARDVPQQSLITHHTLRVKVHIIIRVVYAITHGVDHAKVPPSIESDFYKFSYCVIGSVPRIKMSWILLTGLCAAGVQCKLDQWG